jgi:hypothetical protein
MGPLRQVDLLFLSEQPVDESLDLLSADDPRWFVGLLDSSAEVPCERPALVPPSAR